jgi:hypothetical protein
MHRATPLQRELAHDPLALRLRRLADGRSFFQCL